MKKEYFIKISQLNLYIPDNTKHIKQKFREQKGQTDKSKLWVGDFNISLSVTDRLRRWKKSVRVGKMWITQLTD